MAKINITRIFETSKALGTKTGQELQDFILYVAEAFSQVISALRNNLTFEDNFSSLVLQPTVPHNVPQVINTNNKNPRDIIVTRCFSLANPLAAFAWQYNDQGKVEILAKFDGSPTSPVQLRLVILF